MVAYSTSININNFWDNDNFCPDISSIILCLYAILMTKAIKVSTIILFSLIISFLTYKTCYFIAEKFFFDIFFYQVNSNFGYEYYKLPIETFGKRAQGLEIVKAINSNILGAKKENIYTILVIGDSYVWGLGLKNDQLFSNVLEKKLNKIRPTKIINFGEMGNNTLDYYNHYLKITSEITSNLNIFTLVGNDAFLNRNQQTNEFPYQIIDECNQKFPFIIPSFEIYSELYIRGINTNDTNPEIQNIINTAHSDSWLNPINLCIEDYTIKNLPTENSIYFISDDYIKNNTAYNTYRNLLNKYSKTIVEVNSAKNIFPYSILWKFPNIDSLFTISYYEHHPNALANQMYADILFNEITTNPKWGFIQ